MIASAGRPIPATGPGAATTAQEKAGSIKDTMPNAAKPVTFQTLMVANLPQKHATKDNGPNFYQ
jgi:hypothetical protein